MRYFTSYLKKVILLRNSRYLWYVTLNTDYSTYYVAVQFLKNMLSMTVW